LPEFCDLESNAPIPSLVETEPSTLIISSFGREHLKTNTLEFGDIGLLICGKNLITVAAMCLPQSAQRSGLTASGQ
jgi:hypothetical protein